MRASLQLMSKVLEDGQYDVWIPHMQVGNRHRDEPQSGGHVRQQ
jgi:hypothetical protein